SDPDAAKVVDVARGLEGLRRQDSIHAAAVVITREPLTEYLPIQRKPEPGHAPELAPVVTQYEMGGVEELGLLKMDFLGLRNLDVITDTLDLIRTFRGEDVDIDTIPLDDPPTYELLKNGDSIGVFQLEGGPMRALMRALAPTGFEDVAALVALYRPGPMAANMHNDYADRKNGRKPVTYYHADLEEILAPTYGLMIYQEQLMLVAQRLAGYTLEEADNLRKATGKKKRDLIAKERSKFVAGCHANGYGREFGESMFGIIEPFADYSFNKSHSVGYGFVAYQTAYLKAHHPVEYLAALLTSVKDDKDRTAVYLAECRALGIPVLVPDINVAESDFVGKTGARGVPDGTAAIPFGLSAVRNVGEGIVAHIVEERTANGSYRDFADFCSRVHPSVLNKRALESLIKAGAFDSLGHPRKGLLMVFERIADSALARRREAEAGVMSLFGDAPGGGPSEIDRVDIPDLEFDKAQLLADEKDMLGLYVSDHPLMGLEAALARHVEHSVADSRELAEGSVAVVGGVVTALARRYTRRGDLMATFVLEDLEAAIEVMVFPKTMTDYGHLLTEDAVVCIKGRIDRRDDQAKLVAVEVRRPELVVDGDGPPLRLRVPVSRLTEAFLAEIKRVLEAHPGESPVFIHVEDGRRTTVVRLGSAFGVTPGNGLHAQLRVLLGADGVF
ncbi:MAG TPA: DNA polymerase III subunit alpha, partial [Actinomycetes bacterium]|nr:DNA polymerase III subunit alpha [Actinomycetes bacterium]